MNQLKNFLYSISIILPVLFPTASFGGGHKQFIVQDKIVQLNSAVIQPLLVPSNQYNNAGYWAAISQNVMNNQSEEIANKVVDKLIDELLKRGYLEEVPSENDDDKTSTPIEPTPEEQVKLAVEKIFQRSCISCHKGSEANKIELFDEDGKFANNLTKIQAYSILDRVEGVDLPTEKIMPKNGSPLPDDEIKVIRKWVRSISNGE